MRVAVLHFFHVQQMAAGLQRIQHDVVRLPHEHASQRRIADRRCCRDELAVVADRVVVRQAVFLTDEIIVQAVCGRGVHRSRASLSRYMVT